MPTPFPLASSRLRLRRLVPEDARALWTYRSLPEVARYQSWELFTLDDAACLIARQADVHPDVPGTWMQLAITLADSGGLIGDCGLHFIAGDGHQAELGITLSPTYQGRGLASEAIETILGYLFDTLGKHRVHAITDAENVSAARMFRGLGFRQEAHFIEHVRFKGAWGSEFLFAMLRREWAERRATV